MPPRDPFGPYAIPTFDPVEALTRRRLLTAIPAIGLIAAGVSCGDNDDETPDTAGRSDDFPRTIDHVLGTTTVPTRPERIATLGDFNDLDALLAMDIQPVTFGFTNAWESGAMPWQPTEGLPQHNAEGELDLESLAAANPDLILGVEWAGREAYDRLGEIAPTVLLGTNEAWRDLQRRAGRATGSDARAEQAIADAETHIAAAKEDLAPLAGKKLMVGFTYGDIFYIWGGEVAAAQNFRDLGLNFVGGPEPGLTSVSLEQVNLVGEADILLSMNSDPAAIAAQEASPLFRSLPAVAAGGYDVLDVVPGRAISDSFNALSIPWVLPQFVEMLLRMGDGGGKSLA